LDSVPHITTAPVIGICAVRERARWAFWDQTAHLVADTYVRALQETGAVAVVLPVDPRAPAELLDRIDGLLLIGGADLDPRLYGQEPSSALEESYPARDEFEIALTHMAIERGLPLLGICRGMQLLNVARGGTLLQELADENGVSTHRRIVGAFEGNEHEIELDPGSLAERAIGESLHVGRCHHHQAIDRLGAGLRISGRAREDGVPEAIESADGSWVLGVQWHPEAADKRQLFHAFAEAAGNRGQLTGARSRGTSPSR
jgi:putative glutamine amidotransferase